MSTHCSYKSYSKFLPEYHPWLEFGLVLLVAGTINLGSSRLEFSEFQAFQGQPLLAQNSSHSPSLPQPFKDLTLLGGYSWQVESLSVMNTEAKFAFPVNLYIPKTSEMTPLVIISPGLGGDLATYDYLATHLASYGFSVAIIEHPGSNSRQRELFFAGKIKRELEPEQYLYRPQSITALLDYLEKYYTQKINTQNVGLIGHSLGGYDVWALAGATSDPSGLRALCQEGSTQDRLCLLVDCVALELPEPLPYLRDSRIQAAMAINPIGAAIFGQGFQSITIPMLVMAGSEDIIAPPLTEQFQPFAQLSSPQKYLVLMEGGTHLSVIGENPRYPFTALMVGPDSDIAKKIFRL